MQVEELTLSMAEAPAEARPACGTEERGRTLGCDDTSERAAFERILALYRRRVLITAYRLLGHPHDAEDATQEVFLRLYKYRRRLDQRRDLLPWLYRITVNVCRDLARRRSRVSQLEAEEGRNTPAVLDPQDDIRRADQKRLVEAGLKELTPRERAALVLRDLEGFTTAEVARVLGSSQATVRSQVSSARLKLRHFVERWNKS
jgi:RNA polymerase sigma-70 factor, ECF subfamily